jgi:hypothetical protein
MVVELRSHVTLVLKALLISDPGQIFIASWLITLLVNLNIVLITLRQEVSTNYHN